ncbi:BURP domain-containing protein BNM2A isoform X2 [Morus notabilis]|uniref:BURP domain-containing protein BNM2A isoform X2 n=1 Tax=Morus notabilis TaxID=981085 RepID=UPI000CED360B|nr:BURP domain-containing protein BNM2A isoform X2 [Morus notabilis]
MTADQRSASSRRRMDLAVASWHIILLSLLVLVKGTESRDVPSDNNIIQLPSSNTESIGDHDHHQSDHPKSHMHHMDSNNVNMVFFTMEDMEVGKTMPIYFPKIDPSTSPHLLPRDEASSIPFSLKQLPNLLKKFSFSKDSPQGSAMEDTLKQCESPPIKGETKFCATSLESMIDFIRRIFGDDSFSVVATNFFTKSSTTFQNYTILEMPKEVFSPKMVACHTLPYPYAIYYCHYLECENKVYKILLGGENGDKVEAVAVCHMDTSQWGRNHVSFRILKTEPGTFPVCHFFPAEHLVWVPISPTSM